MKNGLQAPPHRAAPKEIHMNTLKNYLPTAARLLLGTAFVVFGLNFSFAF